VQLSARTRGASANAHGHQAEDDRVITVMNARRAESGGPLLSADQAADVRPDRQSRRSKER
jgi:hypothetical protein